MVVWASGKPKPCHSLVGPDARVGVPMEYEEKREACRTRNLPAWHLIVESGSSHGWDPRLPFMASQRPVPILLPAKEKGVESRRSHCGSHGPKEVLARACGSHLL